MRYLCFWAALFLFVSDEAKVAAQSISVPATVAIEQPGLVIIRATAIDADSVRWWSHSPGLQTFPPDVVNPGPGIYLGFALQPGTYTIGVIAAKDVGGKAVMSLPQRVTVMVGGSPPAPPIPPAPVPPPSPPIPVDALAAQIQSAYTADPSTTKAADVHALAGIYSSLAATISTVSTVTDLFAAMQTPRIAQIGDRLPAIRALIGTDLSHFLPADPAAALTSATQATVALQLNRYALLLKGMK